MRNTSDQQKPVSAASTGRSIRKLIEYVRLSTQDADRLIVEIERAEADVERSAKLVSEISRVFDDLARKYEVRRRALLDAAT